MYWSDDISHRAGFGEKYQNFNNVTGMVRSSDVKFGVKILQHKPNISTGSALNYEVCGILTLKYNYAPSRTAFLISCSALLCSLTEKLTVVVIRLVVACDLIKILWLIRKVAVHFSLFE